MLWEISRGETMSEIITVVITTYNLEKFIKICLEELLYQTFKEFNILIVDDFSNDDTRSIIESYKNRFNGRLTTIFCEKNNGFPGQVRNIALDSGLITGEYVLFLDGDDNIESNMLEKMYIAARTQDADIVCGGYNRVNSETGNVYSVEMNHFYVSSITSEIGIEFIPLINGSLWNKIIRTKCIGNTRFSPMRIGEDTCFLLEIYKNVNKIIFIHDILIHYNVYEKSLMSNVKMDEVVKFSEKLLQIYKSCSDRKYKSVLVLSVFIHIGISACVRIYQSGSSPIRQYIDWVINYFDSNYPSWYRSDLLTLKFLRKLGVKGYSIKACIYLYRMNLFRIFLKLYTFMINTIGIDIKW